MRDSNEYFKDVSKKLITCHSGVPGIFPTAAEGFRTSRNDRNRVIFYAGHTTCSVCREWSLPFPTDVKHLSKTSLPRAMQLRTRGAGAAKSGGAVGGHTAGHIEHMLQAVLL